LEYKNLARESAPSPREWDAKSKGVFAMIGGLSVYLTDTEKVDDLVISLLQTRPYNFAEIARICWDSNIPGSRIKAVAATTDASIGYIPQWGEWLEAIGQPYISRKVWWRLKTDEIIIGVAAGMLHRLQSAKSHLFRAEEQREHIRFFAQIAAYNRPISSIAHEEYWEKFETGLSQTLKPALKLFSATIPCLAKTFLEFYIAAGGSSDELETNSLARVIIDQFTYASFADLTPMQRLLRFA
jgi:hypothetical protein